MKKEFFTLNEKRNVTLTAYIQDVGGKFDYVTKRPAILIIPGGGYQYCSEREADPVAFPYLKAGYQAFILEYSLKEDACWPNPLDDYEQAMELIRKNADEWHIYPDKIAVIGFSAGGHLASAAATLSKNRPNAAILGYAMVGDDAKGCHPSLPNTIEAVDANTCPCFVFATRTDGLVPVINSVKFVEALTAHDVAYESHIYAYGPHGFSTGDRSIEHPDHVICNRVSNWVNDSIEWLKDVLGDFSADGMTDPVCPLHTNADYKPYLSVDCTIGNIMANPAGRQLLLAIMAQANPSMTSNETVANEIANSMLSSKMVLRNMLSFGNTNTQFIDVIDEQLQKIPN